MKTHFAIYYLMLIIQLHCCYCEIKDVSRRKRHSPKDSHVPSISISPTNLKLGVTDKLVVNCTVSADNNSTYDGKTFVSMMISFKRIKSSKYDVLDVVSAASGKAVQGRQFPGEITGHMNKQTGGFLTLHVPNPTQDVLGEYKCQVSMVNKVSIFSSETSPVVRISLGNISVTDIAAGFAHLKTDLNDVVSQIRQEITKIDTRLSKEKNSLDIFKYGMANELLKLHMRSDWITIQRRVDGKVDFYRTFREYKEGFGDKQTSFWLGLDEIHNLTKSGSELKVILSYKGKRAFAHYLNFSVGDEASGYKLSVSGYDQKSTAGDSLMYHNGMKFTTKDKDNDRWESNCAIKHHGGFWYNTCHEVNLNGEWGAFGAKSLDWKTFTGYSNSATYTEMLIKTK